MYKKRAHLIPFISCTIVISYCSKFLSFQKYLKASGGFWAAALIQQWGLCRQTTEPVQNLLHNRDRPYLPLDTVSSGMEFGNIRLRNVGYGFEYHLWNWPSRWLRANQLTYLWISFLAPKALWLGHLSKAVILNLGCHQIFWQVMQGVIQC